MKTNPADKVQHWEIEKLIPYARNSRTHSDEQVSQIAASMREWGVTSAVLVDEEGGIIAGHGRVMAAKKLGMTTLPVMVASGWTDSQKRAFVIADNKLALNAGWDAEMLALEVGELEDLGFDLSLTGFSDEELAAIEPQNAEPGLTDEDEVPDVPKEAVTKLGDIWLLGNHRLMCGDSTDAGAFEILMNRKKAKLLFTDPPYGVSIVGGTKDPRDTKNYQSGLAIQNDDLTKEKLQKFLCDAFSVIEKHLVAGAAWYVWYAGTETIAFWSACEVLGGTKHVLVWVKPNFVFGRCDYHYRHEPVMYGWKSGAGHNWFGDRKQDSVWEGKVGVDLEKKQHPTSKPVSLSEKAILNHTLAGDVVVDAFLGSGSTLIGAEKHNRICCGMQLDPIYCDVIVKRWQDFTGKKAVLESNGKTFDEVVNG